MKMSRPTVMRTALAVLAAGALVSTVACSSSGASNGESENSGNGGDAVTLRYASALADTASDSKAMKWWFERVGELTDGAVNFEEYYSASLLTNEETLEGLATGRADMAYLATTYFPSELPLTQVASVPFTSENGEATARTFAQLTQENELLQAEYDRNGIVPMTWTILTNNTMGFTDPVEKIADMSGKDVRGVGLSAQALTEAGINVATLPAPQIYESIQQGVLQGFSGLPFTNAVTAFKVQEVAPNFVDPGLGQYSVSMGAAMSKAAWDRLSADVQEAMLQASEELFQVNADLIADEAVTACTILQDGGGSVTRLPESEINSWRADVEQGLIGVWLDRAVQTGVDQAGAEKFFDLYVSTVEEHTATATFSDPLQSCN